MSEVKQGGTLGRRLEPQPLRVVGQTLVHRFVQVPDNRRAVGDKAFGAGVLLLLHEDPFRCQLFQQHGGLVEAQPTVDGEGEGLEHLQVSQRQDEISDVQERGQAFQYLGMLFP